ncbi:uncharacterized protein LOC142635854 [Castanea sativa]|uniref:uncharacterized protein LOC142635854 n=1 Tax=Castanea sativa TaxID=21020 RepID=UPI003F653FF4
MSDLVWSTLWRLHIPNKLKIFGWRVCHDILPTRENLARKRIIEDRTCEICTRGDESALHVLWECSVAQDVWAGSIRKLQKGICEVREIRQLVESMIHKLNLEELELFFVQAWLIWSQRNLVLHGGKLQDPTRLVQRAEDFLKEYREDQDIPATGIGAVIRNDSGEVMAAISAKGPAVFDSEEAEVLACRKAVEFAVDSGFYSVIIEGDNCTVMNSIQSMSRTRANISKLGHFYEDIGCIILGLQEVSISCVSRSANTVVHSLARHARIIEDEVAWLELVYGVPGIYAGYNI